MSSTIHYRFKSNPSYDVIAFDGDSMGVLELKNAIRAKCGLRSVEYDLKLSTENGKVFTEEEESVEKGTHVLVVRAPPQQQQQQQKQRTPTPPPSLTVAGEANKDSDPSREDDVIGKKTDKTNAESAEQPSSAPKAAIDDEKTKTESSSPGDSADVKDDGGGDTEMPASSSGDVAEQAAPSNIQVPGEMLCPMCHRIMTDPQLIVCCGMSFCKACILKALASSGGGLCPSCRSEGNDQDSLVPNKNIREAIAAFRLRHPRVDSLLSATSGKPSPAASPARSVSPSAGAGQSPLAVAGKEDAEPLERAPTPASEQSEPKVEGKPAGAAEAKTRDDTPPLPAAPLRPTEDVAAQSQPNQHHQQQHHQQQHQQHHQHQPRQQARHMAPASIPAAFISGSGLPAAMPTVHQQHLQHPYMFEQRQQHQHHHQPMMHPQLPQQLHHHANPYGIPMQQQQQQQQQMPPSTFSQATSIQQPRP
ncbi:hypothetical protein BOX15_Mlig007226g2 [Macrostomum lignano]|uniref:RING-type domain-containing protein n=1 Tax=Macrostomum lignano TaxID=282301 RepID=A0A267GJA4_9PLAT|nr:hypothetical protein BOX15_Mlig007226g2 [Macrostomum lignano]